MLLGLGKKRSGFTLVEIVIVIGIGALLLMMALFGIAEANKAGRDAARKNAISQIISAMEKYAAAHSGQYVKRTATGVATIQVEDLYGDCDTRTGKDAYLDCSVIDPSSGQRFTSSSLPIFDRDGDQAEFLENGYCVFINLESGGAYGANDANKSPHVGTPPSELPDGHHVDGDICTPK